MNAIVKEAVRQEFALSAMRPKELIEANNRETEVLKKKWNRELNALEKGLENLKKLGSEQYLKYRMGEMEEKTFQREKEEIAKKSTSIQNMRADIAERLRTIDAQNIQKNHFLRMLIKGNEKTELTGEVVRTLVHRIEVYPDKRVKVIFAFQRRDILSGKESV